MAKFTPVQRKFLGGCVVAYTVAYINRLNLSAALGGIGAAMGLAEAQTGLLQTAFAMVYAAGQLVNGMIADRTPPYRHMLLGIAGYSVCNLLMGAATSYAMLFVLCLFNGAFQSMLWTPIVRMVAYFYPVAQVREKANTILSLTMVLGHLIAWSISGSLSASLGWRFSFLIPGCIGLAALASCRFLLRDCRGVRSHAKRTANAQRGGVGRVLAASGFFYLLACCLLYGFVRDGIVTWAPQKLTAMGSGSAQGVLSSLLIPLINVLGVLGGFAFKRYGVHNNRRCVALMLGMTALCCLPLPIISHSVVMALAMGMGCACLYGLNPLLTAMVPMEYDCIHKVSLTAGLIDSFIYLGSALAGGLGGAVTQLYGAEALYISWIFCALAAAAAAFASSTRKAHRALEAAGAM